MAGTLGTIPALAHSSSAVTAAGNCDLTRLPGFVNCCKLSEVNACEAEACILHTGVQRCDLHCPLPTDLRQQAHLVPVQVFELVLA